MNIKQSITQHYVIFNVDSKESDEQGFFFLNNTQLFYFRIFLELIKLAVWKVPRS